MYLGDQLFVYGEIVDNLKHRQESAISTLSTAALQEVDRIQHIWSDLANFGKILQMFIKAKQI